MFQLHTRAVAQMSTATATARGRWLWYPSPASTHRLLTQPITCPSPSKSPY